MAQETPFSFHCMICFEEFDPDERYPVVLPCGHTYVCNACAERLDKCMECRTPLFIRVEAQPPQPQQQQPHQRLSRPAARREIPQPPQPTIKKRLPLPKNVVLLSLIEATALASEKVHQKDDHEFSEGSMSEYGIQAIRTMGSMVDVEDDDEESKIKFGASLAGGVAGTYAVAVKEGLEILPRKPVSMDDTTTQANEDVDRLVHYHPHHEGKRAPNEPHTGDTPPESPRVPLRLSYGDRVQIVSFENGWARLSRGYGYVRADNHDLVKGT